jgi:hypothetical protein
MNALELLNNELPIELHFNIIKFLEHPVAGIVKPEIEKRTCVSCSKFDFSNTVFCDDCSKSLCSTCNFYYSPAIIEELYDIPSSDASDTDILCEHCVLQRYAFDETDDEDLEGNMIPDPDSPHQN